MLIIIIPFHQYLFIIIINDFFHKLILQFFHQFILYSIIIIIFYS